VTGQAKTLSGAGSTFVAPMMSVWAAAYATDGGVQVAYQSVGSGAGVSQIQANTVNFGDSDAFMTDSDIAKAKGPIIQIPLVQAPVTVVYNLPGVPSGLRFDGSTLGKIFSGGITSWNDPAIAALNPGMNLPSLPIAVVHRSDSSGTTSIFTDFLTQTSPAWVTALGGSKTSVGKTVAWAGRYWWQGQRRRFGGRWPDPGRYRLSRTRLRDLSETHVRRCQEQGWRVHPACEQTAANATVGITTYPSDLRVDIVNQSTNPAGLPDHGSHVGAHLPEPTNAANAARW